MFFAQVQDRGFVEDCTCGSSWATQYAYVLPSLFKLLPVSDPPTDTDLAHVMNRSMEEVKDCDICLKAVVAATDMLAVRLPLFRYLTCEF